MDYEKRYNEALSRAKDMLAYKEVRQEDMEYLFPELKVSEDERMKREILELVSISGIDYNQYEEIKDWLEKQGKQKQTWKPNAAQLIVIKDLIEDKNTSKVNKVILRGMFDEFQGICDAKHEIEKQGEQAHAELGQSEVTKASDQEPKFSVGDWITDGYVGGQITSIEENYPCYKIVDFMGINTSIPFTIQDNYHLWTIKDAKEGDVLTYVTDEEDLWIMIYWSLYEPYEGHVHYHALLVNNDFSDKGTCCICINNLKPAAKEQRELLFQKMKEAGYEWDAEWKGLKKIEPKKLDADEVIEWLNHRELMSDEFINRFKKYFGL